MNLSNIFQSALFLTTGAFITHITNKLTSNSNSKEIKNKILGKVDLKREKKDFKDNFIVIVGLGGVGSSVLLPLVRIGIKYIRIIDYDNVSLSSLNRHAIATRNDVGKTKTEYFYDYVKKINPKIQIEAIQDSFTLSKAFDYILKGNPNYVVDCIDNLETKIDLIHFCYSNNLKIISSLGAASRRNPCLIRYGEFNMIKGENMAKRMRYQYKKRYPDSSFPNIPCVYSIEKTVRGLTELPDDICIHQASLSAAENKAKTGIYERIRTLPVFACLPNSFGNCIANKVIGDLINYQFEEEKNINKDESNKDPNEIMIGNVPFLKIIEDFKQYELLKKNNDPKNVLLIFNDYLKIAKAFNFSSAVSQKKGNKLKFFRWRPFKLPSIDNIVLVNKNEINTLFTIKTEEDLVFKFGIETVRRIDLILSNIRDSE